MGIRNGNKIHIQRKRNHPSQIEDSNLLKFFKKIGLKNKEFPWNHGDKRYRVVIGENYIRIFSDSSLTENKSWNSEISRLIANFMLSEDKIIVDTYEEQYLNPEKFLYRLSRSLDFTDK